MPFSGLYLNHSEVGMYQCVSCDPPLFSSEVKYDSGMSWPAFKEAHGTWECDESHVSIIRHPDNTLGSAETEVVCKHAQKTQTWRPVKPPRTILNHLRLTRTNLQTQRTQTRGPVERNRPNIWIPNLRSQHQEYCFICLYLSVTDHR
eukprot:XP_014037119.1 PREDICTED: methionine-R-sulfoxide reductase B2, mitochondrial isoform X1 [Salmo salar]